LAKTGLRRKANPRIYDGRGPVRSTVPAFVLTNLSVFIWVYFIRLKGGFFPMAGHPFSPIPAAVNLLLATLVSIPGAFFLYWAVRERPGRAFFFWFLSTALILSPLLYNACSNVSDSVVSGFIIYGSLYWGKIGLWFMFGAAVIMVSFHALGRRSLFGPLLFLAVVSAFPVYSSIETVQIRYSQIFRGEVPSNVEHRYIFLVQAVREKDAAYCDRYKVRKDEGSWLGCNNVIRLMKGEPLLPSPYPTGKFVGFHPLTAYTDPEPPTPDFRSTVDDGRTVIVDEGYYKKRSRQWIRQVAPDKGCSDFQDEFLTTECEAFVANDPSDCLTAECVIDIAVKNMETSYCDQIDAQKHEAAESRGPRKDYVGICYTAVELVRGGVAR
jgi:hypothetical protein